MSDPLLVEVGLGAGDWANVSDLIYTRDPITITRGLQSEDSLAGPSTASLTVDNRDGVFAVRDPMSPLYRLLGRNSPLRISYGRGAYGMVTPNLNGRAQCEDTAALSFLGDLDLRVDLEFMSGDWATADDDIASHFDNTVGYCRWTFYLIDGKPRFTWFPAGTYPTSVRTATATTALPSGIGRKALRVTLDVDNGAAGATVRFYTAPTIAGPWTQLGSDVTSAGVTTLFDTPGSLRVGAASDATVHSWGFTPDAVFYSMELRSGINGTLVASPDFTAQPLDPVPFSSSAFTDAQGNEWTFSGTSDAARIWYGDVDVRYVGEIASLPSRFSLDLNDRWVPITANGILRRLNQGQEPTSSSLKDFTLGNQAALAAYYPLDGAEGTTYSLNLAPLNRYLSTRFYGVADPGPGPIYKYGVDMGRIGSGVELDATGSTSYLLGEVVTPDENCAFDMVFHSPRGFGVMTIRIQDYLGQYWFLDLNTSTNDGTMQVTFYDPLTGGLAGYPDSAVIPEIRDGQLHHLRFEIETTAPYDHTWRVYIDGVQVYTGSDNTHQLWGVRDFWMYYTRYTNQTVTNIAHLTMWANASFAAIPSASDAAEAAFGYAEETAAERLERIATDGGIPLVIDGEPADTMQVGPLFAEPRLTQLRDAEAADMGILHESREAASLLYRTRRSMVGQTPVLTLEFDGGQVADPLEPVDDDQLTRNDVTASRREGGSYRVVVESGRLSVQDPPDGVGLYADEVTVNVATDALLAGVAAWLANKGTLDRARYPAVSVKMAALDSATATAVRAVEVGDLIRITGASAIGEYDAVDLLVLGYTETIGIENRDGIRLSDFTFVCAPYEMYRGALYGTARYDADGSALTAGITSSATSFQVSKTGTTLWTTDAGSFPFDVNIGGERMTVTNVTSATSPQTFTVTRSVNGVQKSHSAGAPVSLWETPRYTL